MPGYFSPRGSISQVLLMFLDANLEGVFSYARVEDVCFNDPPPLACVSPAASSDGSNLTGILLAAEGSALAGD